MDDLRHLYTSFDGRINRGSYWLGSLILAAVAITIFLVAAGILGVSIMAPDFHFRLVSLAVGILFLYPLTALIVKRLHDRDRPAWLAVVFLAPNLVKNLTDVIGLTGNPLAPNILDMLLGILAVAIGFWVLVELGCLRGSVGTNQYGPDPLAGS